MYARTAKKQSYPYGWRKAEIHLHEVHRSSVVQTERWEAFPNTVPSPKLCGDLLSVCTEIKICYSEYYNTIYLLIYLSLRPIEKYFSYTRLIGGLLNDFVLECQLECNKVWSRLHEAKRVTKTFCYKILSIVPKKKEFVWLTLFPVSLSLER